MVTCTFTYSFQHTKLLTFIKTYRIVTKSSNLHVGYAHVLWAGENIVKKLAVLGLQGIVVKCTATIIFFYGGLLTFFTHIAHVTVTTGKDRKSGLH